ncbi:MAG: hypothetical protein H7A55_21815 [Verrucomicrobiaceae bacterium]|nr:hypothetical protein [Verrucomicrobiaceae bacterium]
MRLHRCLWVAVAFRRASASDAPAQDSPVVAGKAWLGNPGERGSLEAERSQEDSRIPVGARNPADSPVLGNLEADTPVGSLAAGSPADILEAVVGPIADSVALGFRWLVG